MLGPARMSPVRNRGARIDRVLTVLVQNVLVLNVPVLNVPVLTALAAVGLVTIGPAWNSPAKASPVRIDRGRTNPIRHSRALSYLELIGRTQVALVEIGQVQICPAQTCRAIRDLARLCPALMIGLVAVGRLPTNPL